MDSGMLEDYFQRISLPWQTRSDIRDGIIDIHTLASICRAHGLSIPFENLDLVYEPAKKLSQSKIAIDVESVFKKIVKAGRGGYCFETNALLAEALKATGFDLYTTAARVVLEKHSKELILSGLEHQIVIVCLRDEHWVCDCGFGGSNSPRAPVMLADLTSNSAAGEGSSRLRRGILGETEVCQEVGQQSMGWYMQGYSKTRRSWEDLYFFTEHEWREKDFEIPNLWCSTGHPLFCKELILAVQTLDGRRTLSGRKLRLIGSDKFEEQDVSGSTELESALEKYFGLPRFTSTESATNCQ